MFTFDPVYYNLQTGWGENVPRHFLLVGINQTVVFGHRAKTNVFNKKTTTRYPYAGFCGFAQRARRLGIGSSCVMGALREGTCVEKWY